ncbi:MAG: hypothetical protein DUD27_00635 [Lachnospiraceae bacterium]|uniref:FliB family protein n=1 Tax=Candidatus Weimeria bifida TaxID=2599074 RepID=A0A6N7J3P3_9FIRM|nr:hypothetical protein [Candidatus Weimeria bifida]RRF97413.1 MAG: hypothetical protein DUD27_00635 [Lachnospiraceae bacterium]
MLYRKQIDFDKFKCIADKCPKSCCEGWQIMIDDKSLKKYRKYSGPFEDRFREGVDFKNSCFRQHGRCCSMLAVSGLCDLQSFLGEGALCNTCRLFPRHIEEFPDIREYSLSLSCPEVVRMMLESKADFSFEEREDDREDSQDYDGFDYFLYDKLVFARDWMLSIAKKKDIPFEKRLDMISQASFRLQELFDEGNIAGMDDVSYETLKDPGDDLRHGFIFSYDYMMRSFELLESLEVMESSWTETINSTSEFWSEASEDKWREVMFSADTFTFEKILESLLFVYFCGSIYDGEIYARAMIAVMSVRWIKMISAANTEIPLNEVIYLYSREVEHSDININALISYFESELP